MNKALLIGFIVGVGIFIFAAYKLAEVSFLCC